MTLERVIEPSRAQAAESDLPSPPIMASRWSIRADNPSDAWQALSAWRGLRAPGRLEAVDPAVLRERADTMDRAEILGQYSLVDTPEDYVEVYSPLITEIKADVVTIQTTTLDQTGTIRMLGDEVLPELRRLAH